MDRREAVARAEDVQDLCSHIGWVENIKPELLKLQLDYQRLLAKSVLGAKIVRAGSTQELTPVQIAGRVEGIGYAVSTIEKILSRGRVALTELQREAANYSSD